MTTPQEPRDMSSRDYSDDIFSQLGLDVTIVIQTLVIAVVSGAVAALLDELFDLPTRNIALTLGSVVAVLNGLTYASFKRCSDLACLGTGLLNGWLAYMAWYFTLQVIISDAVLIAGKDWFEATITGIVAGAIGFAWIAAIRYMPPRRLR